MNTEEKRQPLSAIQKIDRGLDLFETTVSTIALCAMTIVVLVAVVLRYLLQVPNTAGEEISRYLLVTIVYVGISMCVRARNNMGVTIFVDHLPNPFRRLVMISADFVTAATLIFLSRLSWIYVVSSIARPQYSVGTGMPMAIIYAVMAIGLSLSALRSVMLFWNDYLSKNHPLGIAFAKEGDAS